MFNLKNKIIVKLMVTAIVLCLIAEGVATSAKAISVWTQRQTQAHEIAELARVMGLPETDPIIVRAQELWNEEKMIVEEEPPQQLFTDEDADIIAKIIYREGGAIPSDTEKACLAWAVLNRVDAGYGDSIAAVATAPSQFGYKASTPVSDALLLLSYDVLGRWQREKNGEVDVGRVLPNDYLWYCGDGRHNNFRNTYKGGTRWDYSLPSPYES